MVSLRALRSGEPNGTFEFLYNACHQHVEEQAEKARTREQKAAFRAMAKGKGKVGMHARAAPVVGGKGDKGGKAVPGAG